MSRLASPVHRLITSELCFMRLRRQFYQSESPGAGVKPLQSRRSSSSKSHVTFQRFLRYGSVIQIRLVLSSAAYSDKQIKLHRYQQNNTAALGGTFPRVISIYVKKPVEDILKLA